MIDTAWHVFRDWAGKWLGLDALNEWLYRHGL